MGNVQTITKAKKLWLTGLGGGLLFIAAVLLFNNARPAKQANLSLAFFSDDDGQTWFADSNLLIPPFDHNGNTAVSAMVYTYAGGAKKFCAYLVKYTPDGKARLDAQVAEAKARGETIPSLPLFLDGAFLRSATLVKLPGAGNPWVPMTDPHSTAICTVHSPDGSPVDQGFVY